MLATVMTVAWPAAAADHGDAHPDDGVSAGVETLLLEAEEFVPAPGLVAAATTCWTRQNRSQNYFSSAFGAPGSGMQAPRLCHNVIHDYIHAGLQATIRVNQ